jgi:hypothetical protein
LDDSGNEMHVPNKPAITVTHAGDEDGASASHSQDVDLRRFGPGHFLGERDLDEGQYRIGFQADAHGQQLSGCFELMVEGHG